MVATDARGGRLLRGHMDARDGYGSLSCTGLRYESAPAVAAPMLRRMVAGSVRIGWLRW